MHKLEIECIAQLVISSQGLKKIRLTLDQRLKLTHWIEH